MYSGRHGESAERPETSWNSDIDTKQFEQQSSQVLCVSVNVHFMQKVEIYMQTGQLLQLKKNSQLVVVTLDDWDKMQSSRPSTGASCLVVFHSITLEGRVEIMYMTTDASCSFYSFLYLLAVVFIRAFILMNVMLTVASDELKEKLAT